ncbi:MAG: MFS transporter [Streptosporangiales bacterium]
MVREASPGGRLRTYRAFVLFWLAETVSGFGTYITTLAVQVLLVVTLHESATGVGLVNAARWLPYLLFGVLVGVLVDRVRRRPVLVVTDLIRCALLVGIPVLALLHSLSLAVLAVFMAGFGLMTLVNDAASQSFVPRLVPRPLLTRSHARLDQSDAVAQASGPALAGGLVAVLTAPWAVLVDAASYLASALLVLGTSVDEPASRPVSLRGVRGEAREGLRWIYRHRTLTPYAIGTHAWFLCNAAAGVALPVFALRRLELGALGFGVLLAFAGVGAIAGSLAAVALGTRFGAGRVVITAHAAIAVAWALVAASPAGVTGWVTFGAGQLLVGLAMGAQNANEMGYWQTITPDRLQGRANATRRSVNRAMIVVGAPVGGLLADTIGVRTMLFVSAAGFLVVAGALALTPYRTARLGDAYAPD